MTTTTATVTAPTQIEPLGKGENGIAARENRGLTLMGWRQIGGVVRGGWGRS